MDTNVIWRQALAMGLPADGLLLAVTTARQRLVLLEHGRPAGEVPVSTSRYGLGEQQDSGKTPRGFHAVVERIGDGEPAERVFRDRRPAGLATDEANADHTDLILSRVLRLKGLEPGLNAGPGVDSFERTIYLHGTNREEELGRASSRGCIRLGVRDMITLFERTRGRVTWCWIGEG
jgi:UDP-N-acetylmuramate--alanine ligase